MNVQKIICNTAKNIKKTRIRSHKAWLLLLLILLTFTPYYLNAKMALTKDKEIFFISSEAVVLGQYLKTKYPNEKVLIICENMVDKQGLSDIRYKTWIETFKKVFGNKNVIIDIVKPNLDKQYLNKNGKTFMPMSEVMKPEDFDKVVMKHPACNIIISLIGLPQKTKATNVLNNPNKHVALLMANLYDHASLISNGKIVAGIIWTHKPNFDVPPVKENIQESFNIRYLLVTPQNIKELCKKFPDLL